MDRLDTSQVTYYLLFCAQRWLNLVLDLIVAGLAIVMITMAVKFKGASNPRSLGLSLNNILSFNERSSPYCCNSGRSWRSLPGPLRGQGSLLRQLQGRKHPGKTTLRVEEKVLMAEHGAIEIETCKPAALMAR